MKILLENISSPPEKMKMMFEAVSELIKERKDTKSLTVSDITKRAGIGKGTAYEYFSSKDELIANALMYEYSYKIHELTMMAFGPDKFEDRCYKIMDWIYENKEYNQMFSNLLRVSFVDEIHSNNLTDCESRHFLMQAKSFFYGKIDIFMEEGYKQGVFTEENIGKRSLAILSAMVEYAFITMGPRDERYHLVSDEEMRKFIYDSMVKSLNN